ncbi:MAG: glycosyltransferase family 4 protein [Betaproteobacteria bacterium]|nr:glycosyltransferase family 4 protein [Betaproteobacteria bacterium]
MKLALIRQRYNPYGGAERFVSRALAGLEGSGVQVSVVARDWERAGGGDLIRCDPFYFGRLWRDWSFARAACRAIAARQFDLVQAHERIACCDIYRAGDGVHAQWLANRAHARGSLARVLTRFNPYHAYTLAAERRVFASPRLKAVICNSHMVAGEIRRRFRLAEDKLHVIHNGVDLEYFHPRVRAEHRSAMRARLRIAEDAVVFLFVGTGFQRKGVPQLLEAFARLADRSARLAIVGADHTQRAMRSSAARLGIAHRVTFAGGQDDVRPWYGLADCLVLPTLYDPFPNAALEAMACALPLITSTSCGAAELVLEGQNGYVCDALDSDALADRMGRICPQAAEDLGRRARERSLEFDLATMVGKLVRLYESLVPRVASR